MRKYELLKNDTIIVDGHTLHRIRALRNFGPASKGELGGYVEALHNLSHDDTAWVSSNACVYGSAIVSGDAIVTDNARIYDSALVVSNARIEGYAQIYDQATISGNACVRGSARVYGAAFVRNDARISGEAHVLEGANIERRAAILGGRVYGTAFVGGSVQLHPGATIGGSVRLNGHAVIRNHNDDTYRALIQDDHSWITFGNVGSEYGTLTVYTSDSYNVFLCTRGCFTGTTEEFLKAVSLEHMFGSIAQEYELMIQIALLRLNRLPRRPKSLVRENKAVQPLDSKEQVEL